MKAAGPRALGQLAETESADIPDPEEILDRLPVGVCVCNARGIIVRFNRAAAQLWGRTPKIGDPEERFCGSHRLHRLDASALPHAESPTAQALTEDCQLRDQQLVIERPDGSSFVALVSADTIKNEFGRIIGAVSVFRDATSLDRLQFRPSDRENTASDVLAEIEQRRRAERAAQQLAAIVESSEDAIISKDLNGIIQSWNQGAERLFGYAASEVIGRSITILIPEGRPDEEPMILARIRRGERIEHYETIRRRKDGTLTDISLTVSPIRNAEGGIVGASKIARDITDLQKAREQQRLLLSEMHHRVKNLLMLAGSVVALSVRDATTPAELAGAVQGRLAALARANELTLRHASESEQEPAEPTGLRALLGTIVAPYSGATKAGTARVVIEGEDIPVSGRAVTSLALLLHEFATNAAKYGALSSPSGQVFVLLVVAQDELLLTWSENGDAAFDGPKGDGFGSVLERRLVEGQLHGRIAREWHGSGLTIRLVVPVQSLG